MPGVTVWRAMRQPPQRFILSSWPWRVWAHLLGGALTGLASLLLLAALAVSGLLLSVIGVDLVLMLAATFGVPAAAVERRRMRLVEPVPVPNPHRSLVGAGRRGGCVPGCGSGRRGANSATSSSSHPSRCVWDSPSRSG